MTLKTSARAIESLRGLRHVLFTFFAAHIAFVWCWPSTFDHVGNRAGYLWEYLSGPFQWFAKVMFFVVLLAWVCPRKLSSILACGGFAAGISLMALEAFSHGDVQVGAMYLVFCLTGISAAVIFSRWDDERDLR